MKIFKNNSDIKKANKNNIFKYILQNEKTSIQNIAEKLKISMPTVLQNINDLLKEDLIKEMGYFESSGGRKAKALALNESAYFSLGLDITKNNLDLVLVNLRGSIKEHERIKIKFKYCDKYFKSLSNFLNNFVAKFKIDEDKILGVGISIPAIVNKENDCITYSHVLDLYEVKCSDLIKYIKFSCIFINDANASAVAEFSFLKEDSIYLSMSNSIGGSIFLNKNIYLGDNTKSGEFGHMTIVPNGKKCYCGKKGCFDAYCNVTILSKQSQNDLEKFFNDLENNDIRLKKTWKEYLYYFSIAVNNIRTIFDCDIIIGGYLSPYFENYLNTFRNDVLRLNTFDNVNSYIKNSKYDFKVAALGAALIHIQNFMENI